MRTKMSDQERRRRNTEYQRRKRAAAKEASGKSAAAPAPAAAKPVRAPAKPRRKDLSKLDTDALNDELLRARIEAQWLKNETDSGALINAAESKLFWQGKVGALKTAVDAAPARFKQIYPADDPKLIAALRTILNEIVDAVA